MSLRSKIFLLLIAVFGLYALLDYQVQSRLVLPAFKELEDEEAASDIQRCAEALRREEQSLSNVFVPPRERGRDVSLRICPTSAAAQLRIYCLRLARPPEGDAVDDEGVCSKSSSAWIMLARLMGLGRSKRRAV